MPKRADILDRINVAAPCSEPWDEMVGNEQVRFCRHCSLYVHDLSKVTRKDALRLVAASRGRLCVRYYERPDGRLQTDEGARPLTHIKQRLSRVAAGAFTAALSLASNAAAQSPAAGTAGSRPPAAVKPAARDKEPRAETGAQHASLVGTVVDPADAIVPGAKVTLASEELRREWATESNAAGEFQFRNLRPGVYKLTIKVPGFLTLERDKVTLRPGVEKRIVTSLMIGGTTGMFVAAPDLPLVRAVWDEDALDKVKEVLATGVDVNEVDDSTGSTALAEAVGAGNLELVQLLIYAGADPNVRNDSGQTALMRLDEESTPEIVRALVQAGAKVNLKDAQGRTALHYAVADEDKPEIVRALLDAGVKVDARNKEGKTALMIAAEEGNVENVKVLLVAGANPHQKDKEGKTALAYARQAEYPEVVKLLNSYGAFE